MADDFLHTYKVMMRHKEPCAHPGLPVVEFDAKAAKGLSAGEVKKRWPRVWHDCPFCGQGGIHYASFEHYIAGDW